MRNLKIIVFLFALLMPGLAAAQCSSPLPANTVMGRLSIGPGPCEAIPFSTFRTLTQSSGGGINIKDAPYNAKCDGVADDTAAIQSAIDTSAPGHLSGPVTQISPIILPPGTCRFSRLNMTNITGLTVIGVGSGASYPILAGPASSTANALIDMSGSVAGLRLENWTLHGPLSDGGPYPNYGILIAPTVISTGNFNRIVNVNVAGRFNKAARYIYGVCCSLMESSGDTNAVPGAPSNSASTVLTGNNIFGAASEFATIISGFAGAGDWLMNRNESHSFTGGGTISVPAFVLESANNVTFINGDYAAATGGATVSSVFKVSGNNTYIQFLNISCYTDVGPVASYCLDGTGGITAEFRDVNNSTTTPTLPIGPGPTINNLRNIASTYETLSSKFIDNAHIETPVISPIVDGTTAFRINNFAQTHNIVTVDTVNFRLGINKNPGAFDLDVAGAVNLASTLAVTGHVTLEGVTSAGATGTGNLVFGTSPTLVTPVLGAATVTTLNGMTITPSTGTFTLTNGKTLTVLNTVQLSGTDGASLSFGLGGTIAYTSNNLSAFAATTSAQLAGVLSDETGSGAAVFGTSPTIATPTLSTSHTSPLEIGGTTTTSTLTLRSTSGAGTTGADIIFQTGTNGATEVARMTNAGSVGIGTNAPQSKLHVNTNTTQNAAPAQPGATVLEVSGADTVATEIDIESYGSTVGSFLTFSATNGTAASPTQTPSGTIVGLFGGRGYTNSSSYTQKSAQLRFTAAENLTTSAAGMSVSVLTTPVGTTGTTTAATFQASGGFSVGTGTDPGIGSIIANKVVQTVATTVASLPTCNAAAKGARSFVTDANATFTAGIGAAVAAGGANNVPVTCDGTSWKIG